MTDARGPWSLVPFVVLFAADVALTLRGQPDSYYAGEYTSALEANPLARPLLVLGPLWFLAGAAAWLAVVVLLALRFRSRTVGLCLAVASVAHAVGGAAWLVRFGPDGWWHGAAYLTMAAVLCQLCWRSPGPP